jgi:serine/threonine protein kinase
VAVETLQPGGMIADYRIDKVLGAGSFGVTYLAHDVGLNRGVAIKEYMPLEYARREPTGAVSSRNEETGTTFAWGLDRFSEEARTLAQFNHPNIVKVLRLVQGVNGTAYIVMDLLQGENLETIVERDGPLKPDAFRAVFRELLDGVASIHAIGILHRDIKPANIVMKGETPVLIDFGAARDLAMQRKAGFSALVTDGFSPPEQYSREKQQSAASDIYALAATAYFLLTGAIPPSSAARLVGDSIPPIAENAVGGVGADVLKAIDWGLALKVEDRPQTVEAWRAAMPSLADAPPEPVIIERITSRGIDRRALLIAGGGLVVAGAAATLMLGRDTSISGSVRPLAPKWEKTVATLFNEPFAAVAATAAGAVVAAHRLDGGGRENLLALRMDDSGRLLGEFALAVPGSRGHAILPADDGGAFVGGDAAGRATLVRLDKSWKQVWRRDYEPGSITSIMPQQGGLIAGLEGPESSGMAKLLFLDAEGAPINDMTLLDRTGDSVQRIIRLADGAIAALGLRFEERLVAGVKKNATGLWVVRVGPDGREEWRVSETGLGTAQGWDLVEAGGDIFVAGRTGPGDAAETWRLLLMRVGGKGEKLWSRWDYPGLPASGRGLAAVGDGSPRLYLAGWKGTPRVPRFSQVGPDGALVWDWTAPPGRDFARSSAGIAMRPDGTGFAIGLSSVTEKDISLTVARLM